MIKQSVDKSSYKIAFVALIFTVVVVGSIIYSNPTLFRSSTSSQNTTSTTTQFHSNTTTTATQFSRTISLTTSFTTSFPFNNNFSEQAGGVLVSVWVEEQGILLNLTYTPSFKVGGIFKYFASMTNVNSSSHLSLLEYYGKFNMTIYNEKGNAVWWEWSPYATGPTGPPPPNFIKGYNWTLSGTWDTGENLPNQLGPGNPPAKQTPGNYTIIVEGMYYNIDLNKIEQVELQVPLIIA